MFSSKRRESSSSSSGEEATAEQQKGATETKRKRSTDSPVKYSEFSHKLSLKTKLAFSCGHIQNDLCAAIWFSFLLLYFKLSFNDTTAGLLLFLGQVADAISTPLIGYASDKNISIFGSYGRRKVWHLIGTVFVTCSFPLIFNSCLLCSDGPQWEKFFYYTAFIVLFQFGWAAVQVAHLSLITDLTNLSSERVELNAYRQAATVASSICVYTITLLCLGIDDNTITKKDSIVFMRVVHLITGIGIFFSVLFHVLVKEPSLKEEWELKTIEEGKATVDSKTDAKGSLNDCSSLKESTISLSSGLSGGGEGKKACILERCEEKPAVLSNPLKRSRNERIWSDWLTSISFYKICMIYMLSRLYVNVTQVYTPLYLQDTLRLAKRNIAIVPFITYTAGFIFSLLCKYRRVNAKMIMCFGCAFGFISCVWIWYFYLNISIGEVYAMGAFFGIGGTCMLIGSLSMTSDLIDANKISGAFVFGLMSFFDKLINGTVIALVQHLKPPTAVVSTMYHSNTTAVPETALLNATTTASSSILHNFTTTEVSTSTALPELEPTVFYLFVLVFVSGAAVIGTFLVLVANATKEMHKLWRFLSRRFSVIRNQH